MRVKLRKKELGGWWYNSTMIVMGCLCFGAVLTVFLSVRYLNQSGSIEVTSINKPGLLELQPAIKIQKKELFKSSSVVREQPTIVEKTDEKTDEKSAGSSTTGRSIDMISIGSENRPRNVQEKTFARHKAVRYFFRFTEKHDTHDPDCAENLSLQQVEGILDYCHANSTYPNLHLVSSHFSSRKFLLDKQKKNPAGWLCAQKRPLVGLYRVLTEYYSTPAGGSLPDYLFVMDDDSWFHIDLVLKQLREQHPAGQAHVIAGCLIRSQYDLSFSWYWGGFGVILTRAALERLLMPIHCERSNSDKSAFVQHVCHQLEENLLGEKTFFREGMTVVDLIYQYSTAQPYTSYKDWKTGIGYCVHSDMGLAFFFNYYHIADRPQSVSDGEYKHYDRLYAYNGTSEHKTKNLNGKVYKSFGFCQHKSLSTCSTDSHLCHYIPNKLMLEMFDEIYASTPENFRDKPVQMLP